MYLVPESPVQLCAHSGGGDEKWSDSRYLLKEGPWGGMWETDRGVEVMAGFLAWAAGRMQQPALWNGKAGGGGGVGKTKHSGLDMSSFHFKIAFYHLVLCVHAKLLSSVQLFATPWITACQASLSITNSRSSLSAPKVPRGLASDVSIIFCGCCFSLPWSLRG